MARKKPIFMQELKAEAQNYSAAQLEKMLDEIDNATSQWSRMKLLYAIYRIELFLDFRTHNPKDFHGRTKGAVGTSAHDKAVRMMVTRLVPEVAADPSIMRKKLVYDRIKVHPILKRNIDAAARAILRRLPAKKKKTN